MHPSRCDHKVIRDRSWMTQQHVVVDDPDQDDVTKCTYLTLYTWHEQWTCQHCGMVYQGTKDINRVCQVCNGVGRLTTGATCPGCQGRGWVDG